MANSDLEDELFDTRPYPYEMIPRDSREGKKLSGILENSRTCLRPFMPLRKFEISWGLSRNLKFSSFNRKYHRAEFPRIIGNSRTSFNL